jgi:hypothetical protein
MINRLGSVNIEIDCGNLLGTPGILVEAASEKTLRLSTIIINPQL